MKYDLLGCTLARCRKIPTFECFLYSNVGIHSYVIRRLLLEGVLMLTLRQELRPERRRGLRSSRARRRRGRGSGCLGLSGGSSFDAYSSTGASAGASERTSKFSGSASERTGAAGAWASAAGAALMLTPRSVLRPGRRRGLRSSRARRRRGRGSGCLGLSGGSSFDAYSSVGASAGAP